MTREEELGLVAWNKFYDLMYDVFGVTWDRKTFWTNRFHKKFIAIGRHCLTHDLDVVEYMSTTLHLIRKNFAYIVPGDFLRPVNIRAYMEYARVHGTGVERSWVSQINELTAMECKLIPSVYTSSEDILLQPQLPFYAWFRVLYLQPFRESLCQRYGKQAAQQLRQDNSLHVFLRQHADKNVAALEQRLGSLSLTRET